MPIDKFDLQMLASSKVPYFIPTVKPPKLSATPESLVECHTKIKRKTYPNGRYCFYQKKFRKLQLYQMCPYF